MVVVEYRYHKSPPTKDKTPTRHKYNDRNEIEESVYSIKPPRSKMQFQNPNAPPLECHLLYSGGNASSSRAGALGTMFLLLLLLLDPPIPGGKLSSVNNRCRSRSALSSSTTASGSSSWGCRASIGGADGGAEDDGPAIVAGADGRS
jgi:hypothetical protein